MLTAALSLIHSNEGLAENHVGSNSSNPLNDFVKIKYEEGRNYACNKPTYFPFFTQFA